VASVGPEPILQICIASSSKSSQRKAAQGCCLAVQIISRAMALASDGEISFARQQRTRQEPRLADTRHQTRQGFPPPDLQHCIATPDPPGHLATRRAKRGSGRGPRAPVFGSYPAPSSSPFLPS
jgi:hypothetical protein